MSDQKESDKSEHLPKAPEVVLRNPDAQNARNSGKADIVSAERLRTNQSDGSLRRYSDIDLSDQEQSVEISYGEKSTSRTNKLTEAELLQSQRKAALEAQSETIEEMREAVKTTPALEPILALREHAQSLPPGQDKDKYRDLALSQAREVSPDMAASIRRREENLTSAGAGDMLKGNVSETHLGSDLEQAFSQLGKLPLDKQISVLCAGFAAGFEQYRHDENEKSWGRIIGSVEGIGSAFTSVATVVDFGGAVLWNHKKVAGEIADKFGKDLATATFEGIRLYAAAEKCLFDTGASGDFTLPFRQITAAGAALNEQWAALPPREQERIKYRLITECAADAAMGAGGAQAIGKAKTFTGVLDAMAEHAIKHGPKAFDRSKKALAGSIQEFFTPDYAYAGIGKVKLLQEQAGDLADAFAMERRAYVSKLDPTHRLRPIEAARENARLKGGRWDEDAWKKLTPEQKQDALVKDGYEVLIDPEPRQPIDSTELADVFRGDKTPFSPLDERGRRKSFINENGDLVPADREGVFKGVDVDPAEHIVASSYPGAKQHSPFTSVGTNGVVWKYGDGAGLKVNIQGLRKAIADGQVSDVFIIEHQDLIAAIERSNLSAFDKKMALRFAKHDNEFLIRGVVPKRFLEHIGEK